MDKKAVEKIEREIIGQIDSLYMGITNKTNKYSFPNLTPNFYFIPKPSMFQLPLAQQKKKM